MTDRLSVVIPVLNEAGRIGGQLARLATLPGIHDIVVADGGSTDGTVEIVRAAGTGRLVHAPAGRGPQMNVGARAATGTVLIFLHADVELPADAENLVAAALSDPAIVGGAFRVRTVSDGFRGWPEKWLWLADLRSRYARLPYGDQAVFVRREVFDRLGGFAPLPLFEDVEFARRLRRAGRLRILPAAVRVSGRRFMVRPYASGVLMNLLPALFRLGVPATTLARLYGQVR
ncbi:MAG: TIGR04283 family arsenosugar biosynthesis glycosyltransferase [Acidobacteria bacterium]|nr:TIGR04283 family arsenosugar biosynthesis glycosyltransferase [Acidobacteriota bacterium]